MTCEQLLSALAVLVAAIGIAFAMFAFFEWRSLRHTRREFDQVMEEIRHAHHRTQKAMQRIIASYGVRDADARISLLQEAIEIDETAFNGYNALGYAYQEKGDTQAASDAFLNAIRVHPNDKESYFDIARLCASQKKLDLARRYLKQLLARLPECRREIREDPLLGQIQLS